MKKFIALLMVVVLMFTLAACGSKTETAAPAEKDSTPATDEKIIIRLGFSTEPDSHYGKGSAEFERLVEEYTDGKVDVQLFPSATLGNERDMIEGLSLDTLEMCLSSTGPLPNFSTEFQVFDLPFIITDKEKAYKVMDGEIGKEILSSLEPINIKALGFWENGFRHISNSKKEIVTPEDMAGIKIRTMENPIHMATFQLLKAMPTPMAFSELFTALQQGTIDGQENPLVIFDTNKFAEAQKYLSLTGHVYSPSVMMISKNTFDAYPQDIQDAIVKAEAEARTWERNYCTQMDQELVAKIKADGVIVTEVDKELWKKACEPIYAQFESEINPEYIKALTGE
ncbi:MAG: DctP family TRAP transporter solute-binding subunit [Sedimentibacter sp.]